MQADAAKPIKHFHPRFPPDSDPSLSKASALFAAFAFQKVAARGGAPLSLRTFIGTNVRSADMCSTCAAALF